MTAKVLIKEAETPSRFATQILLALYPMGFSLSALS